MSDTLNSIRDITYKAVAVHGDVNSTKDLGRAVVAARLQHGLTQVQLAEALGVTQRYVSELETGKSKTLSARLFDVLDQLGIQLAFRSTVDDKDDEGLWTNHGFRADG